MEPPQHRAAVLARRSSGIDAAVALQTRRLRIRFFDAWVCLCAGAGLRNTELRYIAAADITDDDGVLLVHVRPPRERIVPLRREYSNRVRALMAAHPDQPLAGPFRPQQRDPLLRARSRLQIPEAAANPHTERFRSTWLIRLLNDGFPLNRILEYGGQATYRFDNTIPSSTNERTWRARSPTRRRIRHVNSTCSHLQTPRPRSRRPKCPIAHAPAVAARRGAAGPWGPTHATRRALASPGERRRPCRWPAKPERNHVGWTHSTRPACCSSAPSPEEPHECRQDRPRRQRR